MSPDYKDLLSIFNAERVEFIVVGAHALAAHGRIRATGDLDVWVKPERQNAQKVLAALRSFGAPLGDLTMEDLTREGTVFQIGIAPLRIDILTSIDGVGFEEAWQRRYQTSFAGVPVAVLCAEDLIRNKRAVGRPQDLADLDWLERRPKR